MHRSGFVAIVGRPNVGKSTLLNRVLGEKVAIVSPKPQTTRNRILGVLTRPDAQIALLDTPGVHQARGALNRYLLETALAALQEVDAVLVMVEPEPPGGAAERLIVERVRAGGKPAVLAVNKIDTVKDKRVLLPVLEAWRQAHAWAEFFPVSAAQGDGVEDLVEALARLLPEAPAMYPPDVMTDQAERQIAAEYVREQVLRRTRQEVPYSVAVVVESFDESRREGEGGGLVRIEATIYVERDSQKGILIGKRGSMLKEIGTGARREIERLLGCKVFLGLHVKVEPDWTGAEDKLRKFAYGA
jgi:GTP-binding protein Era